MLRHLGAIAVSACLVANVGCDGRELPAPYPVAEPNPSPVATICPGLHGGTVLRPTAGT
jgi:hypothetical protein